MKQKKVIFIPLILVVLAFIGYRFLTGNEEKISDFARVKKDKFEMSVTTMGELEAFKSTEILVPEAMSNRKLHIYWLSITDLVREGTVVKKGDFVATLDPTEVESNIKEVQETLAQWKGEFQKACIDSSIDLSSARNEIRKSGDNIEDKEIKVEQSKYESKSYQRQAKIELDMAQRSFKQKQRNYIQKERKHRIRISRLQDRIDDMEKRMAVLLQLKVELNVKAPMDGVVAYARDPRGRKVTVGSSVSRWYPTIAILPDLSTILSVTFVKEIDVNKIEEGMSVKINIDAFPGEEFEGQVVKVANIGQDIPDQFLNGFKVEIKVEPGEFDLLPGMTATNRFVVSSLDDQLLIPRPALFMDDSVSYVYKKVGMGVERQVVTTGGENENFVRIIQGLDEGDKVMMHAPES